jgi:Cdc6-like AAA superfamily ATPase
MHVGRQVQCIWKLLSFRRTGGQISEGAAEYETDCGVLAEYESTTSGEDGIPPNIKNFLLTGRPGIGKTTVAEAVIRAFEEDVGGFVTGALNA